MRSYMSKIWKKNTKKNRNRIEKIQRFRISSTSYSGGNPVDGSPPALHRTAVHKEQWTVKLVQAPATRKAESIFPMILNAFLCSRFDSHAYFNFFEILPEHRICSLNLNSLSTGLAPSLHDFHYTTIFRTLGRSLNLNLLDTGLAPSWPDFDDTTTLWAPGPSLNMNWLHMSLAPS